ncbi:MAG: 30S ribosomal protein S15 [Bacteroidia bacterium]|nr:30S ribosomal protein S15 [Bacteroidia bacterium]MCZ2278059.1 30S ribosomal protein S15 [Bacteroidia bacterium]
MALTAERKKELASKYGKSSADTGTAETQIAIFTEHISELTNHLSAQPKDNNTQRALIRLVGKRRRLLDYLIKTDITRYRKIIGELGIRK